MKSLLFILCILLILFLAFVIYEIFHVKHLCVSYYESHTDKAKARFAIISDLHNYSYGKNNSVLIDIIKKEKVDFVVIPGDLVVGNKPCYTNTQNLIAGLKTTGLPVYFTPGNHELKLKRDFEKTYYDFINMLKINNVIILDNSCSFYKNIKITGYTNSLNQYSKFKKIYDLSVEEVIKDIPPLDGDFNILIAHNPVYFEKYAECGAELVVSGHLHGGIIRLPFIGGLLSPQTFFRGRYVSGMYKYKNSRMIVSRGLGVHTIPVRVFNRPEIIIYDLI